MTSVWRKTNPVHQIFSHLLTVHLVELYKCKITDFRIKCLYIRYLNLIKNLFLDSFQYRHKPTPQPTHSLRIDWRGGFLQSVIVLVSIKSDSERRNIKTLMKFIIFKVPFLCIYWQWLIYYSDVHFFEILVC